MKNIALIIFFAALTGLIVWVMMGGLAPEIDVAKQELSGTKSGLTTESDVRKKLTEIKMRRDKIENAITRVTRQKVEIVTDLKGKGITRVADAKGDPQLTMALNNLKALKELEENRVAELGLIDKAISRLEGMISKFSRDNLEKAAGLSEEQTVELLAIESYLDDKLGLNENDILLDEELDQLLDEELKKSSDQQDQELLDGGI